MFRHSVSLRYLLRRQPVVQSSTSSRQGSPLARFDAGTISWANEGVNFIQSAIVEGFENSPIECEIGEMYDDDDQMIAWPSAGGDDDAERRRVGLVTLHKCSYVQGCASAVPRGFYATGKGNWCVAPRV